jgi:hypothetical protein
MIFGKTLFSMKCVFWFSLQLLFVTFLILRRIQRDIVIKVKTSSCEIPVILVVLQWNLNWNLETSSSIKFRENPFSGSQVVPDGRTDMKLIVPFRSFANVSKDYTFCLLSAFISFVRIAEKKLFSCAAWTGFREQNGVCLRRGTNWNFKYKAGYLTACTITDVLCCHRYSCDRWPHMFVCFSSVTLQILW